MHRRWPMVEVRPSLRYPGHGSALASAGISAVFMNAFYKVPICNTDCAPYFGSIVSVVDNNLHCLSQPLVYKVTSNLQEFRPALVAMGLAPLPQQGLLFGRHRIPLYLPPNPCYSRPMLTIIKHILDVLFPRYKLTSSQENVPFKK